MLASVGVTVPPHIPYLPDIPSLKNTPTPLEYNEKYFPTYDHLHRLIPLQDKSENETDPYNKYFMELIEMMNARSQSARDKLL